MKSIYALSLAAIAIAWSIPSHSADLNSISPPAESDPVKKFKVDAVLNSGDAIRAERNARSFWLTYKGKDTAVLVCDSGGFFTSKPPYMSYQFVYKVNFNKYSNPENGDNRTEVCYQIAKIIASHPGSTYEVTIDTQLKEFISIRPVSDLSDTKNN